MSTTEAEVDAQVRIDTDRYSQLRENSTQLVRYFKHEVYSLVILAFFRFRTSMRKLENELSVVVGPVTPWEIPEVAREVALALLDWLLSTRLLLDHSRYDLCSRFGKTSKEVQRFDDARRSEHAHHFGYRLMYDLRDYCTHRGMPPVTVSIKERLDHPHTIEVTLNPTTLLAWDRWHPATKATLQQLDGPFDLEERVVEAMDGLSRVYEVVISRTAPAIADAARSIIAAASEVEGDGVVALIKAEVDSQQRPRSLTPMPLPLHLAELAVNHAKPGLA